MKILKMLSAAALVTTGTFVAQADLFYGFDTDVEGFQNVVWTAGPVGWATGPSVMQAHTAGGWQNLMTKEFSWGPGGGSANQQLEIQALANLGNNARIALDVMVDGASFPAGAETWFQLTIVGNSDGSAGWMQREDQFASVATWHGANDSALLTLHIDQPFSWLGWQPGDTWFQLWTGANSAADIPVNFYIDNVRLYAVPEPSSLAFIGLGLAGLLISRRR